MPRLPRLRRRRKQATELVPNEPQELIEEDEDGHELRMSLWEHLAELRDRILRAFMAVVFGTLIGAVFAGQVLDIMRDPYCRLAEEGRSCELVVLGPTGGIVAYFRVALMVGGVIAVPMVTYQILMYLLPALKKGEKRVVLLSLPAISGLFLIGSAFAWFVLMPPALGFLEGFQPTLFKPEWTAALYMQFVTSLVFWMGVAFETPLVFFVLAILGMISAGTLVRNWRVAIVGSAIAAALITPTVDPVNMFLVMAPLMTLYLVSIFLVMIGRRMSNVG